jgi:hypothetical protein
MENILMWLSPLPTLGITLLTIHFKKRYGFTRHLLSNLFTSTL